MFKNKYGVCVISGLAKVQGLCAALKGDLIKEIIVGEPTARNLIDNYISQRKNEQIYNNVVIV